MAIMMQSVKTKMYSQSRGNKEGNLWVAFAEGVRLCWWMRAGMKLEMVLV